MSDCHAGLTHVRDSQPQAYNPLLTLSMAQEKIFVPRTVVRSKWEKACKAQSTPGRVNANKWELLSLLLLYLCVYTVLFWG